MYLTVKWLQTWYKFIWTRRTTPARAVRRSSLIHIVTLCRLHCNRICWNCYCLYRTPLLYTFRSSDGSGSFSFAVLSFFLRHILAPSLVLSPSFRQLWVRWWHLCSRDSIASFTTLRKTYGGWIFHCFSSLIYS